MTTTKELRELALALPETEAHPHRERESFRVRTKIFATLAESQKEAVLKLSVERQQALVRSNPTTFMLVGWEKQGWTGVRLPKIAKEELRDLLISAWRNVAPPKLIRDMDNANL